MLVDTVKSSLSIVLQGGIFKKDIDSIVNIVIQYRDLFPSAQIILSISSSDFLNFNLSSNESIFAYDKFLSISSIYNSCNILNDIVDVFVFCKKSTQLPPIKSGNPNCNANFQIESAKNGLHFANKKYVLRVRNDLLLKSYKFIEEYEKLSSHKRGEYSIFSNRVLISSLFTLNPFGLERLPFHFSDWFHFGLLSDVKSLWNVNLITLNYMTYYNNNYYRSGSNSLEREFNAKTAIEQYIVFSFFKKYIKNLKLDFHNDTRSRNESIDILIDNFCVVDNENIDIYFPKYNNDMRFVSNKNICISQDNWEYLSKNRSSNYSEVLSINDGVSSIHMGLNLNTIPAYFCKTKFGKHLGLEIVSENITENKIIQYGPHFTISKGKYKAIVYISSLSTMDSIITLRATINHGKEILKEKSIEITYYENDFLKIGKEFYTIDIDFECTSDVSNDFEVVVEANNIKYISIRKTELLKIKDNYISSKFYYEKNKSNLSYDNLPISKLMKILSLFMSQKMRNKLHKDPYLFFKDSENFLIKKEKIKYMKKYNDNLLQRE